MTCRGRKQEGDRFSIHNLGEFVLGAVPSDDAWSQVSPDGKHFNINAAQLRRTGLTGSWTLTSRRE